MHRRPLHLNLPGTVEGIVLLVVYIEEHKDIYSYGTTAAVWPLLLLKYLLDHSAIS